MNDRSSTMLLEAQRLESLYRLRVLDSAPEPLFDQIVATAAQACGMPISLISLIDAERQWLKAGVGVGGVTETPRGIAFCAHTIESDAMLQVPDATLDPRFADNPLVRGAPGLRFYAGVPLQMDDGERVGTLCVSDTVPRRLSGAQAALLASLSRMAAQALMMRRDLIERTVAARSDHERAIARSEAIHRALVEDQSEFVSLSNRRGELVYVNAAYARHFRRDAQALIGSDVYAGVATADLPEARAQVEALFRTGLPHKSDFRTLDADGQARWVSWTHRLHADADGAPLLHSVGRDVTERKRLEQALAERENFLRLVTDALPMQVAYFDAAHRYRFANLPLCRRLGRAREEVLGRVRAELCAPLAGRSFEDRLDAALAGVPQRFVTEVDDNGARVQLQAEMLPDLDADGRVRGAFATALDITAQLADRQELQRQALTLRSVTDAIPAMVAVVGPDRCYRFTNRAFAGGVGMARERIVGRLMVEVLGPALYEEALSFVDRALAGEPVSFEKAPSGRTPGRHLSVQYIPLRLRHGGSDGFVTVVQDITRQKLEENRLKHLSQRDALTGLLNRAGLEIYLNQALNEPAAARAQLGLMYIDLDRFKPVNDTHGHAVGDELLKQFGRRLGRLVRPTDAVVRLGGDEFAVVLTGVRDSTSMHVVADKVVAMSKQPFEIGELQVLIGASVGMALGLDGAEGWPAMLKRADAMLYRAKAAGRGQACSAD